MNRIIIIGNGYDLAHGLKTSYRDFIDDFWEKEKEKIIEKTDSKYQYEDDVIKITSPWEIAKELKQLNNKANVYDWFNEFSAINGSGSIYPTGPTITFKAEHKNIFLKHISEKNNLQDWVDIEEEYYFALNESLNDRWDGGIDGLNNDFSAIQEALKKYLVTQEKRVDDNTTRFVHSLYSDSIKYGFNKFPENSSKDILFLNFNYTKINSYYCQFGNFNNRVFIHIHGELDNPNNPIIFGYGDEIGDRYKHIEDKNDNKYLEYIKSVKYLETSNYKKLLTFIESEKYEIFIIGHSCGVSDRTLLNTLFEHKNCESIRVFYHKRPDGTDNFGDLSRNISRIFTDKDLLRRRVVSKEDSLPV